LRWAGEQRELGTLDCPTDPKAEGAEVAFMAEAVLAVKPCFDAFDVEMPPQGRFMMVVRALAHTYLQNGRDAALEDRLATFYMKMYWEDWCKLMDPEGKLGTPPPAPAMN
jgi:hypothetical protein